MNSSAQRMDTSMTAYNHSAGLLASTSARIVSQENGQNSVTTPPNIYAAPPKHHNTGFVDSLNRFGVLYFLGLTFIMYATILCLSGKAYPDIENYLVIGATYLVSNILLNFYLCRTSRPFYTSLDASDLPNTSSNICDHCQIAQPARCHHCPVCRHCIPKRDHHCFFTGVCVGERNQGHFTVYCLQCGLGLLMGFAILSKHMSSAYYEVFSLDFYHYFPPYALFDLILGNTDITTFFSVILLCGGLVSGMFSLLLFIWQFMLICCDVTSYEASLWWHKRSIKLRFRPCYNLTKTFGRFWPLCFLFPVSLCFKHGNRKQYL